MKHTEQPRERVTRTPFRLTLLLLLAVLAAFAATAGSAAAKTSCGEKVIDDWYGSKTGQLSKVYPLHCYKQALNIVKNRPDLDVYSNARQDILLAMQLAIARNKNGPPPGTQQVATDPQTADVLPSWHGGPDAKNGGHAPTSTSVEQYHAAGRNDAGPVASSLQSSSPSSVPLPAIVLAAIAGLLLALGGAAFVARRRQTRRQTLTPRHANGRNP
jgi:hypothetical protein